MRANMQRDYSSAVDARYANCAILSIARYFNKCSVRVIKYYIEIYFEKIYYIMLFL